jgi:hypothetical protein
MVKAIITQKLIGMLIRHGMTVLGGYMVAGGYADEEIWQAITGGAVAAGGVALSFGEKALYPRFQ